MCLKTIDDFKENQEKLIQSYRERKAAQNITEKNEFDLVLENLLEVQIKNELFEAVAVKIEPEELFEDTHFDSHSYSPASPERDRSPEEIKVEVPSNKRQLRPKIMPPPELKKRTYNTVNYIACRMCDKVVSSRTLSAHYKVAHDVIEKHAFYCDLCERPGFDKKWKLESHLKVTLISIKVVQIFTDLLQIPESSKY